MATYYVRKTGSDANNGLSAAAAWLTIGKALGATGIASGDTVYIGAGIYREVVTVNMTSATAETLVIGDVDGSQTGDAGEVRWTAYTTNDKTAPASAALCNLNGRDFLTFKNICMVGGIDTSGSCIKAWTALSTHIKLERCSLTGQPNNVLIHYEVPADTAIDLTIDSCIFSVMGHASLQGASIRFACTRSAISDYSLNVLIQNCVFLTSSRTGVTGGQINVYSTGAAAFGGGGVAVYNCSFIGNAGVATNGVIGTTAGKQVLVYNCHFWGYEGVTAAVLGQIVEDYNMFQCGSPRTNVTAGANSQTVYAPGFHFGQELIYGGRPRPFGSPTPYSPALGFGNQAGGPSVDLLGRPRPSGSGFWSNVLPAVGAFERSDIGVKEVSTVRTGSSALKILGPGVHDFDMPVDATETTVSIYARYDTNHATTNKPQLKVLNGTEAGVADATATMTAAVDTWEQLSLTFTPTAKGVVTVRLVSRAAAGNGNAFFDDMEGVA